MRRPPVPARVLARTVPLLALLLTPPSPGRCGAPARAGMALIPAGEFLMGSPDGAGERDERPRHKVLLDAFYMDKREVTAGEYAAFAAKAGLPMRDQPSWSCGGCPVVYVTWHDAADYCAAAGKRLPTEAEWEKAARGGTDSVYGFAGGPEELGGRAWYAGNSGGKPHPAGLKKPNAYGLYDTLGNVWEWVSDWYDGSGYGKSPARNPGGPEKGSFKALRGGAWHSPADGTRAAVRSGSLTTGRASREYSGYNDDIGFRCAASAGR